MRRIVSVKLYLFLFSFNKASYAFSVIEIVLVAILHVCVHIHRIAFLGTGETIKQKQICAHKSKDGHVLILISPELCKIHNCAKL